MEAPLPDAETFLRAMARRYVWDQSEAAALARPDRIIRRVMDLGTIDDAFDLEPIRGRTRLAAVLRTSPAGAMRPRSWSFWHHRLGLIGAQEPAADAGAAGGMMRARNSTRRSPLSNKPASEPLPCPLR